MRKQFLTYSISTALNRATNFLFLPLATQCLTLDEFGQYSLALGISQLSFAFFCLNGNAAIAREGAADIPLGFQVFNRFFGINLLLFGACALGLAFIPTPVWLFYGLLLGAFESLHQLIFSLLRIANRYQVFFIFTLLKALGTGASFLIFKNGTAVLNDILNFQLGVYILLSFYGLALSRQSQWKGVPVASFLPYCLFLLPTGVSQWIMNGSDRFVIKYIRGDADVGFYSIAYNIALVLMVINSGIALTVPQAIFKEFPKWITKKRRFAFSLKVTLLSIITFTGLMCGLKINQLYLGWIANFTNEHFELITWVCAAIYTLSFYYVYSNIIFYHKKTHILTAISIVIAALNIVSTYVLVSKIGLLGASISTFISYFLLTALTYYSAAKMEKNLEKSLGELVLWVTAVFYMFAFHSVLN